MRTKIFLAFGSIILFVVLSYALVLSNGLTIRSVFHELKNDVIPGAKKMTDMKWHSAGIGLDTFKHLLEEELSWAHQTHEELNHRFLEIEQIALSHLEHEAHIGAEEKEAAEKLIDHIKALKEVSLKIVGLDPEQGRNTTAVLELEEQFNRTFNRLTEVLDNHAQTHGEELDAGSVRIEDESRTHVQTIWISLFAIAMGIFGIGVAVDQFYVKYNRERDKIESELLEQSSREKKAADHANQMAEKAQRAVRARSEFLANMSHEIRTPMNAILGFTEILRNEIKDDKYGRYLNSIDASGKTLLRLIDDILDLSKLEAGKLPIQTEATNLSALAGEIERMFALKIDEKGLIFYSSVDPSLPASLILDEIRLRQILINVVGNAVKFTETGSIHLSIRHKYPDDDHSKLSLVFEIKDTGIGVPEEQQKEIFEAFTQQDGQKTAKFGGTGLGLAITRRLVDLMGGEISLESAVGEGTTFCITIHEIPVGSISGRIESKTNDDLPAVVFEKATVLIVDDIETNLELLTVFLDKYDFNLLTARNGIEAIDAVHQSSPDLILMDMKMPELDGYEATRILKSDDATCGVPIVAITASAFKNDTEKIRQAGCDGVLIKPVARRELIEEMIRFLPHSTGVSRKPIAEPFSCGHESDDSPSPELSARLPELHALLKNQCMEQWSSVNKRLIMSETKLFAVGLKELGGDYSYPPLTDFGEEILSFAQNFDVGKLTTRLKQFPSLVDEIRHRLRSDNYDGA